MVDGMRLVVDTNVLISALLVRAKTYELIMLGNLELFVPEYSLEEIYHHKSELRKRMGVEEHEFLLALNIILSQTTVVSRSYYQQFEPKAKDVSPDPTDFTFFALAFAMKLPIWTNETKLKNQKEVRIYNTRELLEIFGLIETR